MQSLSRTEIFMRNFQRVFIFVHFIAPSPLLSSLSRFLQSFLCIFFLFTAAAKIRACKEFFFSPAARILDLVLALTYIYIFLAFFSTPC